MGLTPLSFVGVSQFSTDFQTILTRAVQIAEIPVQQLQNRDLDVIQKKTLFSDLSTSVSSLGTSLSSLIETAGNRALSATSSNSAVVTVSNTGSAIATSYTINSITSIATAASEVSLSSYADSAATPVASASELKLVVGAEEYSFTVNTNTLIGIRDQINALGAGVTASILTTEGGNYLSISANTAGENAIQLYDDPDGANTALLTAANAGTNAVFELNGIPITQSQNLVNSVIPGVTFTLKDATASPVTLTLATDRSQLSGALQDFVNKYNATRTKVDGQVGAAAGLLSGNYVVRRLQTVLRGIASFRSTEGTINSLTDLGITFDNAGKATFDSSVINGLSDVQINDAFEFVGNTQQGLGAWAPSLTEISDPISGLIAIEQEGLDRVDKQLQEQIAQLNQRIDVMRRGLALKLQQADGLLASLEGQQNLLSASLESLSSVLYGRRND